MAESVAHLKSLYNVEATFEYTGRRRLARALCDFFHSTSVDHSFRLDDHKVLITGFPLQLLRDVDVPLYPVKGRSLYFHDTQILILTMPGLPHEILTDELRHLFKTKVDSMNCQEELIKRGSTTEELDRKDKEADGSWGPAALRRPTCVLEVSASQSTRQLQLDARRWLESEISYVTQVITAKIHLQRHEIILTIWQRTASRQVEKKDEVYIELHDSQPIVGANRCLQICFEQLFRRPPTRGTAERDLVFSARELSGIARRVWIGAGVIPPG